VQEFFHSIQKHYLQEKLFAGIGRVKCRNSLLAGISLFAGKKIFTGIQVSFKS